MDPISHIIFGRLLISLDRRRQLGRHAVAACLLGAVAPDVDAVVAFFGWDIYLGVHQVGTHSFVGSVAVSLAAAALVYFVARSGRYLSLVSAAWVGTLSHLAFDLISGATIQPAWPLFSGRTSVPLVAMADPWLIAACAASAVALWLHRHDIAKTARYAIVALGTFLALKAALMPIALSHWTAARGSDAIINYAVEAEWGSLTGWNVFDRTSHALRKWRVHALEGPATLLFSETLIAEPAIVTASKSLDTVQNFLRVHELGFARVLPLESGAAQVLWSDVRYCWPETPTINPPLACALWFGGNFDRNGRPVTQIVHVSGWRQRRPVAPSGETVD